MRSSRFTRSFLMVLGAVGTAAGCSGSTPSSPARTDAPPASSAQPDADAPADASPDRIAAKPDGGPKGPAGLPAEPGIGYIKQSPFLEALYFDSAIGKSVSLCTASPYEGGIRRHPRGGRHFAFVQSVGGAKTVFVGHSGKQGAAKPVYTLASKNPSVERAAWVEVDASGTAFFAGEYHQKGFVDLFRDGERISLGPGRADVGTSTRSLSFVDAAEEATAWSFEDSGKIDVFVSWSSQSTEEVIDADIVIQPELKHVRLAPNGRCVTFPAKLIGATAQVGLGVRCRGVATEVPAASSGVTISDAWGSVLWHPSLDRFAAVDRGPTANDTAYVASKSAAGWSLEKISLPSDAPKTYELAVSPDGSALYVIAGQSSPSAGGANHLFVVPFDASGPLPQAKRIALGANTSAVLGGFRASDGRLAVVKREIGSGSGRSELVLVDANGNTETVFESTYPVGAVAWSPDGTMLAAMESLPALPLVSPEIGDLYVVPAGGGAPRKLNASGQTVRRFRWSDASDGIAFVADAGSETDVLYYAAPPVAPAAKRIDDGVTEFLADPPRGLPF